MKSLLVSYNTQGLGFRLQMSLFQMRKKNDSDVATSVNYDVASSSSVVLGITRIRGPQR
jgi:hypothetical protein